MREDIVESVRLLFQQGGSDKEYRTQLVNVGEGFKVNFQYGRRDGALKAGTKTAEALDHTAAKKIYDKLVASKTAEGYTTAEGGVAFQGGSNEKRVSGLLPQLLNPVAFEDLEPLLVSKTVVAQQKHDGERRLVKSIAGVSVQGINRKGLNVPLPISIVESLVNLSCVLDGELVGDVLYVFDVLEYDGQDLRRDGYLTRIQLLEQVEKIFGDGVKVVYTAYGELAKRSLLDRVRELGQEGVAFKDIAAPYEPGRPNSGGPQLKFKLVESATVRVRSVSGDKRSVGLEVSVPRVVDGEQEWENALVVPVGFVTIPANHPVPAVGQLCEVQYLYAFEAGSLFQPVYKGVRDDLDAGDLSVVAISQLKFKRKHEEAMAA